MSVPESPYAPPKSDVDVVRPYETPPAELHLLSRTWGGLTFAYSALLSLVFFTWLFISGGVLVDVLISLLGAVTGLSGLVGGSRLASARPAGFPIWLFVIGHGVALLLFVSGFTV